VNIKDYNVGVTEQLILLREAILKWINKENNRTCVFLIADSNVDPNIRENYVKNAKVFANGEISSEERVFPFLVENKLLDLPLKVYLEGAIRFLYFMSRVKSESPLIELLKNRKNILYCLTYFGMCKAELDRIAEEENKLNDLEGNGELDYDIIQEQLKEDFEMKFNKFCDGLGWRLEDESLASEFADSFPILEDYVFRNRNNDFRLDNTYLNSLKERIEKNVSYILSKYEKGILEIDYYYVEKFIEPTPIRFKMDLSSFEFLANDIIAYSGISFDAGQISERSKDEAVNQIRKYIKIGASNLIKGRNIKLRFIKRLDEILENNRGEILKESIEVERIKNHLLMLGSKIKDEQKFLDDAHKLVDSRMPFKLAARHFFILFAFKDIINKLNQKNADYHFSEDFTNQDGNSLNLFYTESIGNRKNDMQLFGIVPCTYDDLKNDSKLMFQV
jgi:hypothetical protein